MRKWLSLRSAVVGGGFALAAAAVVLGGPPAVASNVGTGPNAVFTTFVDPTTCLNGNGSGVNCNIYTTKDAVYASGGPVKGGLKGLPDGTYFFAVVAPGGQSDPNDGASDLLSTDAFTCREFQIAGGALTYPTIVSASCAHGTGLDPNSQTAIQLIPYLDTPNPGGVYILAVCQLPTSGLQPVVPSACKYDAFKVRESQLQEAAAPTVTKDANASDTFTWGISKSVDMTRVVDSSGTATFTYTVSVTHDSGALALGGTITVFDPNILNGSTVPISIDSVSDVLSDGTVCSVTGGAAQTLTEAANDFAYSCPVAGLPSAELDNTVTVTWSDQNLNNGDFLAGGSANFTFANITFTPIDDSVVVTDPLASGGTLGTVSSTDPSPTLFTYTHTVTGTAGTCVGQDNTATFTTNTTETTGSASQSVQLCTPVDLTVSKDATTSYTRTYSWSILKSVDKTRVDKLSGSVVFNYTVVAAETGFVDSHIQATGTITVTNPNDFEDITLQNVTDAVDNGGSCSITGGSTTAIVPAGKSVTLTYLCTYSAPLPANGTNTATATWDAGAAKTPTGSASGTAAVTFGAPTSTVHKTITVTDSVQGQLGTVTATDPPVALALHTFTYSRTINVIVNTCASYTNTATIVETGQTSSQTVTVCGGVAGGLTMGFWQNKNGQSIITGFCGGTGATSLHAFLTQYNPFKDDAATTCAGEATYAYNIIKVANASGASMNAMLKAQMLATALDVYFSDPALGGNKIGAPAPLGGVNVDLTTICNMLDSGGSGTCSGAYTNTSSGFGGGTCQTVSALLSYAASQSNAGGSTWYVNVKATQQLAKNTFDAINNAQAFSC